MYQNKRVDSEGFHAGAPLSVITSLADVGRGRGIRTHRIKTKGRKPYCVCMNFSSFFSFTFTHDNTDKRNRFDTSII